MENPQPVRPLRVYHKMADAAMRPLMFVLGKCKVDSIQETHPWHIQNISPDIIDPNLSVLVSGGKEAVSDRFGPLFHMFGGWKQYVVLEADPPFHIGWVHRRDNREAPVQSAANRLQVADHTVRLLSGPQDSTTQFFALTPEGQQIKLRKVGSGTLGDKQFPGIRLL